jgi:glutamyl-tRNA synthetase
MEESIESIKQGLDWLGLENDGFSVQSQNLENHLKSAAKLLVSGDAYFCFCTEEELEKERQESGPGYKYSGKCRDKCEIQDKNQTEEYFFEKLKKIYFESQDSHQNRPVLRFNSLKFEQIEFDDLISGHSIYQKDNLDDFILLKNTGIPTFMFAVVVDDINSCVTHIIRGNDHHTNSAKHLMIYDALKAKRPVYGHLPLIMSEDGTKMSKRKNAVDIMEYKKMGFLPEAILNYLLLLGFSPKNDREFLNKEEMIKEFEISKVHNSPARFDSLKLKKINQHYISQKFEKEPEKLKKIIESEDFYLEKNSNFIFAQKTKELIFDSLGEIVKRIELLSQIPEISSFYFKNWFDFFSNDVINFLNEKISSSLISKDFIENLRISLTSLKNDFNSQKIDELIHEISKNLNLKKGEIMKIFRAIFTGIFNSYSISFIIENLGFDEIINRLNFFEQKFFSKI